MKTGIKWLCLVVVVVLLASCGGSVATNDTREIIWSGAGRNSMRTGRASGEVLYPFGALWAKRVDGLGISSCSVANLNISEDPEIETQVVFVSGGEKSIYAFNAVTGNELWRINLPAKSHAPVYHDKKVVFISADGVIQCLSAESGHEIWALRYMTTDEELSYEVAEPVISGGAVYFGFSNGLVLALNLEDGKEKWRANLEDRINSSPVVVEGKLIVADYSRHLGAYEAHTGNEIWTADLPESVVAPICSDGKTVFVCGAFGSISALNVSDGEVLWEASLDGSVLHTPCIVDGNILIPTDDGKLVGLNTKTGEEIERFETELIVTGIVSAGNHLLFATENGKLQAVNLETHTVAMAYEFATWQEDVYGQSFGDLAVVAGRVFVSDGQSKFFCLVAKDIAVKAHSVETIEIPEEEIVEDDSVLIIP